MDKLVLLAEIRAVMGTMPDFSTYTPTSKVHLEWLAKADALLGRWSVIERTSFRIASIQLIGKTTRNFRLGQVLTVLHRAEADLALDLPLSPQQVFGPGAVYDYLKALRELIASATRALLIVDPYLDEQVFDTYLSTLPPSITCRLLASRYGPALKASLDKFVAQTGSPVSARISKQLHDRVVFVDDASCWVLGQSIKDAAAKGPTYMAPLAPDAAQLKLVAYNLIWDNATPL